MTRTKLILTTAGVVLVFVLLTGASFLGNVLASAGSPYGPYDTFTRVLRFVKDNYVEEVDDTKLMDGAIVGMLERLDPHSTYLDADRNKKMQERNRGNFEGIGISFAIVDGNLTVVSPIEGTPSWRLGLRPGDIITKIDGGSARGIKEDEVFDKLRGPRGSSVHITLVRQGEKEPLEYDIVREQIPIFSVPYAFMLRPEVGYVRMIRFSATTSDELAKTLQKLREQGMKKLVLDLRGNAGGYLNEAIAVSDKFLPAGKKIVYTVGRLPDSNEEYSSTGRGDETGCPLVVMVDHGSASASEIVSGAMQDWDRGLVVGETTFGKGLVQRQYQLPNSGALLLTVARYFTPSGRLIQRDYSDRDKYLMEDVETIEQESAKADSAAERPEFHTGLGRIVYGGGGITPDHKISKRYLYPRLQQDLDRNRAYFEFAAHYLTGKDLKYAAFDAFDREVKINAPVVSDFRAFLDRKKIAYNADSLAAQDNMVRRGIKAEIARTLFGENERYRVIIDADPVLIEALTYLPEAETMLKESLSANGEGKKEKGKARR
jgi:carboxyl-terminal processing protease